MRRTLAIVALASVAATLSCCPKNKILWRDKPPPAEPPDVVEPDQVTPPKPLPDRSGLPKPQPAKAWAPPAVASWKMPNGITVWHLQQRQAPLVSLTLVLPNGAGTDPMGKAGATQLMVDMLDEGAGGKNALELGKSWQRLATDYSAGTSVDLMYFSLDMLSDTLDASLKQLGDVLRKPSFPIAEFNRRKAQMAQSALAGEASPAAGRSNVLRRVLNGTGVSGRSPNGTKTTVKRLLLSDVRRQYTALVKPEGAQVIAVGDVSRAELDKALKAAFGDWKGKPLPKWRPVESKPLEKGIHIVDYPDASQSAIAVARRSDRWAAKDHFDKMLMNRVLGGMFTSRLNMNLREDKGYTYGARSAFVRRRLTGTFLAYAGVKAETTAASLMEIAKEISELATGARPVTDSEFITAKGGLLLGYPAQFETFGDVTEQIVPLAQHGLPADWLNTWPDKVKAVDRESVTREARRLLQTADGKLAASVWDEFVIVVAGPREKIEPELRALQLPLFPYDAEGNRLKKWEPPKKKAAPAKK